MRRACTSQWWPTKEVTLEPFTLSAETRETLENMGHNFTEAPQIDNHVAAILVGAPSLGGKPIGALRYYGAIDPRRNTGLVLGY